ncbi:hypothetical protein CEV33_3606 [Brucella grignonensis]|uniref:Uncharacterized protein n=1 Tax=Brucella grignonensis TaxID=94627 RepID=A0A256EXZ9_9HYPH|nr:hypothetical protein CEV33_3606 [Brucella grignonensis]
MLELQIRQCKPQKAAIETLNQYMIYNFHTPALHKDDC